MENYRLPTFEELENCDGLWIKDDILATVLKKTIRGYLVRLTTTRCLSDFQRDQWISLVPDCYIPSAKELQGTMSKALSPTKILTTISENENGKYVVVMDMDARKPLVTVWLPYDEVAYAS